MLNEEDSTELSHDPPQGTIIHLYTCTLHINTDSCGFNQHKLKRS